MFGAAFMFATVLVFGLVALSAGIFGEWLSQAPKAQRVMNIMAGTVLAGLAIKLAFAKQVSDGF